jgi:hypothetical protein
MKNVRATHEMRAKNARKRALKSGGRLREEIRSEAKTPG